MTKNKSSKPTRAELEQLRHRETLCAATERVAQIGHYEWNYERDRLESCSEEYARIFDMTVEEVMKGHDSWEKVLAQVHPDDRQQYLEANDDLRAQHHLDMVYRVVLDNGDIRHLREICVSVVEDEEIVKSNFGLVQDITQRVQHAFEREQRDDLARQAESLTDIGYYIYDEEDQSYIYISEGFSRIHGSNVDTQMNSMQSLEDDLDRVVEADRQKVEDAYRHYIETGEALAIEYRILRSDGEERWLRELNQANSMKNGRVHHTLGVLQDITRQKNAEQEIIRAKETLEQEVLERTHELASTVKQLEKEIEERNRMEVQLRLAQKLESIGQLAAGIAHEINTPTQYVGDNIQFLQTAWGDIQPILNGYHKKLVETLASESGTNEYVDAWEEADIEYLREEMPHAIDQALDGVSRIKHIVRAMKHFSHPDDEGKSLQDLNAAIESTVTVAQNEWKYVADLEFLPDEDLPKVPCIVSAFNQVILNIVVNAAHSIEAKGEESEKGKISIRTQHEGDNVIICISDNGTGIPQEIIDRVFDPFFTTKEVGKGTGQGLSIAYKVINEQHGGDLTVKSKTNHGTTFMITLPLTAPL